MRVKITLSCTECKQRNYNTMKDKKNTPDRIELNKYCPFCKTLALGNHSFWTFHINRIRQNVVILTYFLPLA